MGIPSEWQLMVSVNGITRLVTLRALDDDLEEFEVFSVWVSFTS